VHSFNYRSGPGEALQLEGKRLAARTLGPGALRPRRVIDVSGMVPITEVRGLLAAVIDALERWVPENQRQAELADLIAVAEQIAARSPRPLTSPRT
jgi:hypothetical protein